MANLSIHLPIFIACASDVHQERGIAKKVIDKLLEEIKWDKLHLTTFHWEWDSPASALGTPQEVIDKYLDKCELVIVIFGNQIGAPISISGSETGMQHELRIAKEKVTEGSSDNIFLYFKKETKNKELLAFKRDIISNKALFFFEYFDGDNFEQLLRSHLRKWIERWRNVPLIVNYTLKNSNKEFDQKPFLAENKIIQLRRKFKVEQYPDVSLEIGNQTVANYQRYGPQQSYSLGINNIINPNFKKFISLNEYDSQKPLRRGNDDKYDFQDQEWFYYFCAVGLNNAILKNDIEKFAQYPYINPIHQYLSLQIKGSKRHSNVLVKWLRNKNNLTDGQPIVRNFAAYVLGTMGAREAEDDLAYAARHDKGEDVRLYAIMSLGRLKSRKHLDLLTSLWFSPVLSEDLKLFIGQSITNIIGLTDYAH